ncbi:MAG: MaoC/PaaZ C-terminal domain-containing protein [Chloroflexi bacterium]|nr:MaoC/PaaZ C-terminal domain-containing protein [Chloroflexota bacterium]MCY4246676.1 MaoC/PaaZ C-terminal domain-containing protein [Chloroflexota bacterium]
MNSSANSPRGLYFEEFVVGQILRTRARTITESDLVAFAGLTGDYNPMHTDAEYCEGSFMGQRVAHGLLTLSYAVGQAYQLGILERTVLGFRGLEMKFSAPVFIGDTIHAELKVAETRAARRLGGGVVALEMRVIKQGGSIVQKGSLSLLMMSQP